MFRRPALVVIAVAMSSCHAGVRTTPCDPYHTPHLAQPLLAKSEARSAHAPYITGDCKVCHKNGEPVPGEDEEQARVHLQTVRPVNEHCVSCHAELFRAPPRGHPPQQAFCASCHDPHASRQRKLLLEDDTSHACLEYPPPYPVKVRQPVRGGSTARTAAKRQE